MKKSFFHSPDYVKAVDCFDGAGKGFRALKQYQKALECFTKEVECLKNDNDHYSIANTYMAIAEIYCLNLKDFVNGVEALKNASFSFQVANKFNFAIKGYSKISDALIEEKQFEGAEKVVMDAFDTCYDRYDDKLIHASFEQTFNKLLDILCMQKKWVKAIEVTQKYIESQLKFRDKDNYRINKTYMKLALLRVINGEDYMVDQIYGHMYDNKYDSTSEDVNDIRKCIDAIKNANKKDFTFCVSNAFPLFENYLLKGLQEYYQKNEKINNEKNEEVAKKFGNQIITIEKNQPENKMGNNNDDEIIDTNINKPKSDLDDLL